MWSLQFWKDAAERMLRTAAQFVAFVFVAGETGPVNAFEVDWRMVGGAALMGAFMSLLMSMGAQFASPRGTASLVAEVKYQPKTPIGTP